MGALSRDDGLKSFPYLTTLTSCTVLRCLKLFFSSRCLLKYTDAIN